MNSRVYVLGLVALLGLGGCSEDSDGRAGYQQGGEAGTQTTGSITGTGGSGVTGAPGHNAAKRILKDRGMFR